jgi:hypothetical protein
LACKKGEHLVCINTSPFSAFSYSNSRITSLAARLVEPNDPIRSRRDIEENDDKDDDALFAELEEEIENNSNSFMREHSLQVLKRE